MKILFWDCETSPNLADVWGLHNQDVSLAQLRQGSFMMSWAAKWYGERRIYYRSIYHDDIDTMRSDIYDLMSQADAVVTYNGNSFDRTVLNRELLMGGFTPHSPVKQIDLFQVVKRQFRFPSLKLQYVTTQLGLDGKLPHEGHQLWVDCLAMKPAAWKKFKLYNIQDVVVLEELYNKLLPWIHNHPHHGLYGPVSDVCKNCASSHLERRGYAYTNAGKYQQYRCHDCGGWSRGNRRLDAVTTLGAL